MTGKKTRLKGGTYHVREMMIPVFKKGECVYESPSVMELQKIFKDEMATMYEESKRLTNPHKVHVDLSQKLWDTKKRLLDEYHAE